MSSTNPCVYFGKAKQYIPLPSNKEWTPKPLVWQLYHSAHLCHSRSHHCSLHLFPEGLAWATDLQGQGSGSTVGHLNPWCAGNGNFWALISDQDFLSLHVHTRQERQPCAIPTMRILPRQKPNSPWSLLRAQQAWNMQLWSTTPALNRYQIDA